MRFRKSACQIFDLSDLPDSPIMNHIYHIHQIELAKTVTFHQESSEASHNVHHKVAKLQIDEECILN